MPWNDAPKDSGNGSADKSEKSPEGKPNPWTRRPQAGEPNNPWGERKDDRDDDRRRQAGASQRLDELLRRANDRFGGGGNGGGGRRRRAGGGRFLGGIGLPALAALALLGWLSTGVFVVDAGEVAVIQTLGRYDGLRQPGLHVRLPDPFQSAKIINIQKPNRSDFGSTQSESAGLMLTSDEAVVNIGFSVFWRVTDPEKYFFNIEDPESAVASAAESAMREVVGKRPLEPIITGERDLVANDARLLAQKILDYYNAGVEVTQVNLTSAEPPQAVVEPFRDVVNAGQDAERKINEAETTRNKIVPEARGEAAKIVQAAEAYREQVVREAEGDAARFNAIYEQYRLAPQVTRRRMYLETLERIYGRVDKVILDDRGAGAVPYLPLSGFKSEPQKGEGR